MQKIINLDLKNIKHYLTGREKIIVLGFLVIVFGFMFSGSAFADNVNYSVSIAPSLKLTIPDSSLILNLTPPTKTFDSKNLTVTVGTNNTTGYKLTLSTPDDNTNLNRDSSGDSVSATIPTLDAGTYTESTFTTNKWGYKINSNTAIPSTITTDYVPFVSGNTLMESDTAVNHDETELTFAAKIDYLQPAGAYNTTLQFNIVANPLIHYIQDFTKDMCSEYASSEEITLIDKRDNNDYTVRYINGNCWMTQNLRFIGTTSDTTEIMTLDSITSNMADIYTPSSPLIINYSSVSSVNNYNVAQIHNMNDSTHGVYYNYAAASAMTIIGNSNSSDGIYDICPAGWKIPTYSNAETIFGNTYVDILEPADGGGYNNGSSNCPSGGCIWTSSAGSGQHHYAIHHGNKTRLSSTSLLRSWGNYIRCIAK